MTPVIKSSSIKHYSMKSIHTMEQLFIKSTSITSENLMECAGIQCAQFLNHYFSNTVFHIICGRGNNGADGLTIARLLKLNNKHVHIYLTHAQKDYKKLAKKQLLRCKKINIPTYSFKKLQENIKPKDIIIDAISGIGLKKQIKPKLCTQINTVNSMNNYICSIDVPSGCTENMHIDKHPYIKADITVTLGYPKCIFNLHPNMFGSIILLNIGLPNFAKPNHYQLKLFYE